VRRLRSDRTCMHRPAGFFVEHTTWRANAKSCFGFEMPNVVQPHLVHTRARLREGCSVQRQRVAQMIGTDENGIGTMNEETTVSPNAATGALATGCPLARFGSQP
jgi:hypothetical protein